MTDDPFERAVQRLEATHDREEAERRAKDRDRRSRGRRHAFRIHATVFVAVQLLLVVIWATTWLTNGAHYPWFLFPLFGWGIGLAAHYAASRDHQSDPVPADGE